MPRKAKPKYKKLSQGELDEYVSQRLAAGDSFSSIQRDLGYRSPTSVTRIAARPDVKARLECLLRRREEDRAGGEVPSASVLPGAGGDEPGPGGGGAGAPPEDCAGASLEDCVELAYDRIYEVLKYGTYLGRRVDPEKMGLKAVVEVLGRAAKAMKEAGAGKGSGRGSGLLSDERLAELRRQLGLGQSQVVVPGQTLPH